MLRSTWPTHATDSVPAFVAHIEVRARVTPTLARAPPPTTRSALRSLARQLRQEVGLELAVGGVHHDAALPPVISQGERWTVSESRFWKHKRQSASSHEGCETWVRKMSVRIGQGTQAWGSGGRVARKSQVYDFERGQPFE